MTDNYTRRRYGYNRNSHWWGKAHRARLIDTDQYVRTSEIPRLTIRWGYGKLRNMQTQVNRTIRRLNQIHSEYSSDGDTCWCGRRACTYHQENS